MSVLLFLLLSAPVFADEPAPVLPSEPTSDGTTPPGEAVPGGVIVEIFADPAVARARAQLFQDLKDQGYRKGDHKDDRTVFKSYVPYHPRVIVHDDGWVYLKREPPRVHIPGKTFADQGAGANYLWCILAPTACVSIGGWMVSPRKYQAMEGDILDAIHKDVLSLNDAVARKQLELRVNNDIPADCETIWEDPAPVETRRRLLYTYWDTRLDTPEGDVARAAIMRFIKGVVMQSGAPFSTEEIAEMNTHRHCEMVFDPRLDR